MVRIAETKKKKYLFQTGDLIEIPLNCEIRFFKDKKRIYPFINNSVLHGVETEKG
jgi:hypothetical protein